MPGAVDGSVGFVAAVRAKYEHKKGSEEGGELVGGDQTGQKQALSTLARVFLPDSRISSAGEDGEISTTCGAIEELDLGGNEGLDGWASLQSIAAQLPKLHWFGIDRIKLTPLTALPEGFGLAFGGLRTLCASGTGMQWDQLLFLASAMPKLEELHMSSNGIATLETAKGAETGGAASVLGCVRELYLESNCLTSWSCLAPLASLPSLTLLNVNHNQLGAIPHNGTAGFGALRHLMLRANPIDAWASIDALDSFSSLTEARLAELPLTKSMSGAAARRTIIARVARLKALNGSEVRTREREDAERFYLRQVASEYPEGGLPEGAMVQVEPPADISDAPTKDEYGRDIGPATGAAGGGGRMELRLPETEEWDALRARHPRWAELLVHHGTHVTRNAGGGHSGGVIANELVEVTLRPISAETAHLPACVRKLPGGLPLKSIKLIACQLFKVRGAHKNLITASY